MPVTARQPGEGRRAVLWRAKWKRGQSRGITFWDSDARPQPCSGNSLKSIHFQRRSTAGGTMRFLSRLNCKSPEMRSVRNNKSMLCGIWLLIHEGRVQTEDSGCALPFSWVAMKSSRSVLFVVFADTARSFSRIAIYWLPLKRNLDAGSNKFYLWYALNLWILQITIHRLW